ncbi:MAG: exonuclease SbcCD subunit D [Thermoproteus sp.]|nr:exonuclease SbcCD subunit D [Thermoproteus sp.]
MVRILHLSDAHLGRVQYHLPQREEDYHRQFVEVLKLARQADAVLITGDLFDSRRPSTRSLVNLLDALEGIDLPIYAIGGNHDYHHLRPDETPLRVLDKLRIIRLLCFDGVDAGGVYIYGACAMPRSRAAEFKGALLKAPPHAILAIHQAVEGVKARYPADVDEYTMPQSAFAKLSFSHIAAGHVHDHAARHPLGILWAGSIEVWDASEFETWDWRAGRWELAQPQSPKGAILIDAGDKSASARPVEVPTRRRMLRLRIFVESEDDIAVALGDAARRFDSPGAVVRIELYGEVEAKRRAAQPPFSRALYVDVIDRLKRPKGAVAFGGGSVYAAIENLLKDRLGAEGAAAVLKALSYVREGELSLAKKVVEDWLNKEDSRGPAV